MQPDYRLSETTRRIPFVNYTDSVRISMGTSMLKQAIPLVNAQRPLVGTGHKEELKDNVLNEKFSYDSGKVKEITESNIVIELPNGEIINQTQFKKRFIEINELLQSLQTKTKKNISEVK